MAKNFGQIDIGQNGSAYLADADTDFTPPTGKVVVAILSLDDVTEFNTLTPDTSGYIDGTTGVAGTGAIAYMGSTVVAANGTNADAIPASETFPAGVTIYGRWTKVQIDAGAVIMYFGNV
tara:strand:- start:387 stop:746 length:360 start_codon:yes stop_codon:yes gene_type:complete